MTEDYSISGKGQKILLQHPNGYGVRQGSHAVGSDSPFHRLSSAEVMNAWSFASTPNMPLWHGWLL